jgi:hypothetical protein
VVAQPLRRAEELVALWLCVAPLRLGGLRGSTFLIDQEISVILNDYAINPLRFCCLTFCVYALLTQRNYYLNHSTIMHFSRAFSFLEPCVQAWRIHHAFRVVKLCIFTASLSLVCDVSHCSTPPQPHLPAAINS